MIAAFALAAADTLDLNGVFPPKVRSVGVVMPAGD